MLNFIVSSVQHAVEKIRKNPQLIYTIVVAFLIVTAFVFMAERFIGIANDAQERLINVRVGSLQDAFAPFATDSIDKPEYLNQKIDDVIRSNETIKSFRIIVKKTILDASSTTIPNAYVVTASDKKNELGTIDQTVDFLYTIASSDSTHSITIAEEDNGERMFKTARALVDTHGNTFGVLLTTQTLSEADKIIQKNITNSIILLIIIIILILFLFLRHSKIIDYMTLYKKLKEVDQMKDNFIAMASHELRTPLTIIRGYVEIISNAPEITGETRSSVTKIKSSIDDLKTLITDMLDVSKIEQGRMLFEFTDLNPKQMLEETTESFKIPAAEKNLSIYFDTTITKDDQYIHVDKEKLKQVFVNLIGNAVKYTPKGDIKVSQYIEKNTMYIRISDIGLGMSAEEKERLFEKFYRIRTKETENIHGTGLGLWITWQIVKGMNGTISVESIKGVGSHFIIAFPLVH